MNAYNYQLLTDAAKEAITEQEYAETLDRTLDILNNFSDRGENRTVYFEKCYIAYNLRKWANGKAHIIKAMKAHPSYDANEPFKIVGEIECERELDLEKRWELVDALRVTVSTSSSCGLIFTLFIGEVIEDFTHSTITEEDVRIYENILNIYSTMENYKHARWVADDVNLDEMREKVLLSEDMLAKIKKVNVRVGMKTSKVVRNLITTYMGNDWWTEEKGINPNGHEFNVREKMFAVYADAMNPTIFTRKTVVSVDPCDYLLMSNGNSWSSCYTIDNTKIGGYNGEYSNGTWSYMNDECTIITYVIDNDWESCYCEAPKIYRQCVMWNGNDNILAFSRLYPQASAVDKYKDFRKPVTRIISEMFDIPNYWKVTNGGDYRIIKASDVFLGYNDIYHYNNLVRICYNKASFNDSDFITDVYGNNPCLALEKKNEITKMRYGSTCFCPSCGNELEDDQRYICASCDGTGYVCNDCGYSIDEDDVVFYEGEAYCRDCCEYCEYFGEYYPTREVTFYEVHGPWGDVMYSEEGLERAMERGNVFCCEECGEYFTESKITFDDDGYIYCDECYEEKFTTCEDCCALHEKNDMTLTEDGYICDDCMEERKLNEADA